MYRYTKIFELKLKDRKKFSRSSKNHTQFWCIKLFYHLYLRKKNLSNFDADDSGDENFIMACVIEVILSFTLYRSLKKNRNVKLVSCFFAKINNNELE